MNVKARIHFLIFYFFLIALVIWIAGMIFLTPLIIFNPGLKNLVVLYKVFVWMQVPLICLALYTIFFPKEELEKEIRKKIEKIKNRKRGKQ